MSKKIVIFDIDGTLANIEARRGYVRGPRKERNWRAFNESMHLDGRNEPVIAMFNAMQGTDDYVMLVFTGRGDDYKDVTEQWLSDNGIFPDKLYMRRMTNRFGATENGHRDSIVKNRMLADLSVDYPDVEIFCAIDDRPQVVKEVWNANDIFCFDVGQNQEDF